ncbi:uncharacterized protein LOC131011919 isoform X1 [Salvia miltiorrhiza]|uniref:uncharacterized protein LOC131011919 isoform X1 n=1 Tax=Salvia miltiorrhiza TaxID=226208 RepID=UPI0025AD9299|nr:uncharacterized protein LOC131011919 isoform X1 [Salvia miltiorrhiza]
MAYVERGVIKDKRSIWRLKTITDFFWAIINLIRAFFATMFSMEKSEAYRKGSGASKKWDGGGPGGPGSGPYGGGPRGPPRGLDNVRGIDHSKFFPHHVLIFPVLFSFTVLFVIDLKYKCCFRCSSCLWLLLWRLRKQLILHKR